MLRTENHERHPRAGARIGGDATVTTKRVSPAILPPLKEALTLGFWYKPDLRAFLTSCLSNRGLVAHLDWTDYKRNVVAQLVDTLARDQHKYFEDLLTLILATADITDPAHLKRVDDGQRKYADAVEALKTLRDQVEPYRRLRDEEEQARRNREQGAARAEIARAVNQKLEDLRSEFFVIVTQSEQARGYALEKFLNALFALFDIDARAPFRIAGEQIDGAFSHEGTEFLLEAKWQGGLTGADALDTFAGKIGRKLDNTLGLFVSMNGFQPAAVELHSRGRSVMVLMDGADLNAVVEGRISLPELITRKRQHAARTGAVFLSVATILG
jgi:restriction endonuclease Mrr